MVPLEVESAVVQKSPDQINKPANVLTALGTRNESTGDMQRAHIAIASSAIFFTTIVLAEGHIGDLSTWRSWVAQLQQGGISTLDANYPPFYLLWLDLLAHLFSWMKLSVPGGGIFKFWLVFPGLIVSTVLGILLARRLVIMGQKPIRSSVFWGLILNPAVLLNGPIWGQVDILPLATVIPALLLAERSPHDPFWLPSLIAVATLTKFQAIVFLPLIVGLCMRNPRRAFAGLIPATMIVIMAFFPFWNAGKFPAAFHQAYTHNLTLYPYTTLNAGNFWYLVSGNMAPDNSSFIGSIAWLTPKRIGILIFGLTGLWIMFRTWLKQGENDFFRDALILMVIFFTFATGMHERYLLMAVPLAAFATTDRPSRIPWFITITIACYVNMNVVRPLDSLFFSVSAILLLALICFLLLEKYHLFWRRLLNIFLLFGSAPILLYSSIIIGWLGIGLVITWLHALTIHEARIDGRIPLVLLDPNSVTVNQKRLTQLRVNRTVRNNSLSIGGNWFSSGFGIKAPSIVEYQIPEGVDFFSTSVGIDDESEEGSTAWFIVEVDDQRLWISPLVGQGSLIQSGIIPLPTAGKKFQLIVISENNLLRVHADWINPAFLSDNQNR